MSDELSATEAAALLGVSERTIRRWATSNKLPKGWVVASRRPLRLTPPPDSNGLKRSQTGSDKVGLESELDRLRQNLMDLREEVIALRAENRRLTERVQDLQRERDWLRQRIDALDAERIEVWGKHLALPSTPEEQSRQPFWRRWFNRRK